MEVRALAKALIIACWHDETIEIHPIKLNQPPRSGVKKFRKERDGGSGGKGDILILQYFLHDLGAGVIVWDVGGFSYGDDGPHAYDGIEDIGMTERGELFHGQPHGQDIMDLAG